jgi:hypothetical protein
MAILSAETPQLNNFHFNCRLIVKDEAKIKQISDDGETIPELKPKTHFEENFEPDVERKTQETS